MNNALCKVFSEASGANRFHIVIDLIELILAMIISIMKRNDCISHCHNLNGGNQISCIKSRNGNLSFFESYLAIATVTS